jgi:hypothetical protein
MYPDIHVQHVQFVAMLVLEIFFELVIFLNQFED